MRAKSTLIYVHDPMCSWCWGFRPTLAQLMQRLPASIGVERLLGGLAPDSDAPMPNEMQQSLQDTWRRIQARIPGTTFNFEFWRDCAPRRSTWPACRAVIAARQQSAAAEALMILAIQQAYYLYARNPSDTDTLVGLARDIGLDTAQFETTMLDVSTQKQLEDEIARARSMGADSFPSLRLNTGNSTWPIAVDYLDADSMLEQIAIVVES